MFNPFARARLAVTPDALTPTGSDQSGALELQSNAVSLATGDGSAGVRLPSLVSTNGFNANVGQFVAVFNNHATLGLNVYPHVGGDVNDGTQNAAVVLEGRTLGIFVALDTATWGAIFTANS